MSLNYSYSDYSNFPICRFYFLTKIEIYLLSELIPWLWGLFLQAQITDVQIIFALLVIWGF